VGQSLRGCATLPTQPNKRRNLQWMSSQMFRDAAHADAALFVDCGIDIHRHVLVEAIADDANRDSRQAFLLGSGESGKALHLNCIAKRTELTLLQCSRDQVVARQKHFGTNRPVFLSSHPQIAGTLNGLGVSELLYSASNQHVTDLVSFL